MIQANELRLGNWVYGTDGSKQQVTLEALKYLIDYKGIHQAKPIPLTEEILLTKSGATLNYKSEFRASYDWYDAGNHPKNMITIKFIYHLNQILFVYGGEVRVIEYVHELQNGWHWHTKEELEISL